MNAQLSREIGYILGKALPGPTEEERDRILVDMQVVTSINQMPVDTQQILARLKRQAGG